MGLESCVHRRRGSFFGCIKVSRADATRLRTNTYQVLGSLDGRRSYRKGPDPALSTPTRVVTESALKTHEERRRPTRTPPVSGRSVNLHTGPPPLTRRVPYTLSVPVPSRQYRSHTRRHPHTRVTVCARLYSCVYIDASVCVYVYEYVCVHMCLYICDCVRI